MLCYKQRVISLELGRYRFNTPNTLYRVAETATEGSLCLMRQGSVEGFGTKGLSKSFSYVDEWVPCRDLSARSVKLWHSLFPPCCLPCTMKISFCPSKIPFKVFLLHILRYTQENLTTVGLQLPEADSYHTDQHHLIVPPKLCHPSDSVLFWLACLSCSLNLPIFPALSLHHVLLGIQPNTF